MHLNRVLQDLDIEISSPLKVFIQLVNSSGFQTNQTIWQHTCIATCPNVHLKPLNDVYSPRFRNRISEVIFCHLIRRKEFSVKIIRRGGGEPHWQHE